MILNIVIGVLIGIVYGAICGVLYYQNDKINNHKNRIELLETQTNDLIGNQIKDKNTCPACEKQLDYCPECGCKLVGLKCIVCGVEIEECPHCGYEFGSMFDSELKKKFKDKKSISKILMLDESNKCGAGRPLYDEYCEECREKDCKEKKRLDKALNDKLKNEKLPF